MPGEKFVHDERFLEAFANTEHRVLGVKLRPYCLWYQLNLEVAQSPALLGDPMTPYDLWVATRICSSAWTPSFTVPNLKAPGKLRFLVTVGRFNFKAELAKFAAYLNDFCSGPKMWPNHHKGEQGKADRDIDETLELALYLANEGRYTWMEAWTMPLGVAHWASVGIGKLRGADAPIWTPEHEEMFTAHKIRREAKIDARGKEIAAEKGIPFDEARKMAHDEHWAKVNTSYSHGQS